MLNKPATIIGIDASNIRQGGGITHLSQLLAHADPKKSNFDKVIVWSNNNTLDQIPLKPWLVKGTHALLEGNLLYRTLWQIFFLKKSLKRFQCDLLFIPGGSYTLRFKPTITMNQNLLPFEYSEIARYKFSLMTIKLIILRFIQKYSFIKADAIIFLSRYSKRIVEQLLPKHNSKTMIIPHGIEKKFFQKPKKQSSINSYSTENPFKIIYVSSVEFYKHQWNVVEAVYRIIESGYPVEIDFYGAGNKKAIKKLRKVISRFDKSNEYIRYNSEQNYTQIQNIYFSADLSIFSSSCETFGQILLESMAAGLPIACSDRSAMPEVLLDSGVYFNPLDIDDIENSLKKLISSVNLRQELSEKAYQNAQCYSWDDTAFKTFKFFRSVIDQHE